MLGMLGPSPFFSFSFRSFVAVDVNEQHSSQMTRSSTSPFFLLSLFLFKKQRSSTMTRSSTSPFVLSSLLLLKKQRSATIYDITFCNYDIG